MLRFVRGEALNKEATAMRQIRRLGHAGPSVVVSRLKDHFIYEEYGERKIIFKSMILLYNLRARLVGINQIRRTSNARYVLEK
jgi:hypothetical protein